MGQAEVVRISTKGQIVLPKRFRDRLRLDEGDYVTVCELSENTLLIEKTPQTPLEKITAELRAEAKKQVFSHEELEARIKALRAAVEKHPVDRETAKWIAEDPDLEDI